MNESLPLSAESVAWLQGLARGSERGEWVAVDDAWPSSSFRPCIWLGLVEQDGDEPRFRLTLFGWDALANLIEAVEDE